MGLVIQESLSLKEIFAPLKGTLLLHLLETVLVSLKDLLRRALGPAEDLLVEEAWILGILDGRAVIHVAPATTRPSAITRRRPIVGHGNSIYVVSTEGSTR